ncbi:MAG: C25 family cysteine peptidase [Acidobacteriota bacterium]
MKKIVSAMLLVTFVLSACLPTFAQKRVLTKKTAPAPAPAPVSKVDSVLFDTVDAVSDGNGVVLHWSTKSETRVVGYYVYRVTDKGRELVNQSMVLGSAAKMKGQTLYGEQYDLYDPQGTSSTSYVIESVDLDGRRISTERTGVKYTSKLSQLTGRTSESFQYAESSKTPDIEKLVPSNRSFSPNTETTDLTTQRWVAAQPGAKIAVRKNGMYRVTQAELQAAGFAVGSDSANWRLFMNGVEQAMIVGPGNQYVEFLGKGVDTPESDTRIYYLISDTVAGKRIGTRVLRNIAGSVLSNTYAASAVKKERSSYVNSIFNGDAENYWGRIVTTSQTTVPFSVTGLDPQTDSVSFTLNMFGFSQTSHTVNAAINGHAIPALTGDQQTAFSATLTIPTNYLIEGVNSLQLSSASSGDFSMFDTVIVNYGRKYQADQNSVSFVTAGLKRADVGGFAAPTVSTVTISDTAPATLPAEAALPVPASSTPGLLRLGAPNFAAGEGSNAKVTVTRVFGNTGAITADLTLADGTATGGAACGAGVDYVNPGVQTVNFADGARTATVNVQLCADGVAEPNETFTATLSNPTGGAALAQSSLRVFDTSEDGNPLLATNLSIDQNSSLYTIKIPSHRSAQYYAIDDSYELQSPAVTPNNPSTLSATTNGANLVIISHGAADFMAAAENWANYRRSAAGGSFTVKVVDVSDIFDEFNYGVLSSTAINDFLKFTYSNWQTPPQYVLLMGDGSYDARNYEGNGYWDMVPMKIVTTVYSETGSDEALADFDGDGLAEMAIGRIPARTSSVITTLLNKTMAFETPANQSFSRGALFAFDFPNGWDFEAMSHGLRDQLPADMPATFVNRGDANAQSTLISEMNTGKYIVNYSGHGSTGLWAATSFFSLNNVPALTNSSNQSIFTMLTCLNGYFLGPVNDSLSEVLLKSTNGGAVVTWASTGLTTPDIQTVMGDRFYSQLNAGNIKRMGDLIRDAKGVLPAQADVRFSWVLLGDPMLQVRP